MFAAPEGLVALNATGRWVYALGYWNNVLYQYDTLTAKVQKQVVGSACGHVSRNFVVDLHGHVYVPRLEPLSAGPDTSCRPEAYHAVLVELNTRLQEVSTQPLDGYLSGEAPAADHGIIAFAKMADGTIAFTTHSGHLYHVIALALLWASEPWERLRRLEPSRAAALTTLLLIVGVALMLRWAALPPESGKQITVFQKELSPFREEQLKPAQVGHLLVNFNLGEIRIYSKVKVQC